MGVKNYVQRHWSGCFEKGVIEYDDVMIWTALKLGLEKILEKNEAMAEMYKKDSDLARAEDCLAEAQKMQKLLASLEVDNEVLLEEVSIKKKKIDFHFAFDLKKLTEQELLNLLNERYPGENFCLVPHSFKHGSASKHFFQIPGKSKAFLISWEGGKHKAW